MFEDVDKGRFQIRNPLDHPRPFLLGKHDTSGLHSKTHRVVAWLCLLDASH